MKQRSTVRELACELAELLLPELRAELGRDVLDVPAVMTRYGLSDPRAARAAMHTAGGTFVVARRLLIHRATLEAWERSRSGEPVETPRETAPARRARTARALPRDFWRAGE